MFIDCIRCTIKTFDDLIKNATHHSLIYHQNQCSQQAVKLHNVQPMQDCLIDLFIYRILSISILNY